MIDAAIIGLGWWGKTIVGAVQGKSDRLRFVRGVSKEPDTVEGFARQHGFDLSTELADALDDPRVKAVVLATPHSLHPDQIVAAAGARKAVFSEKPLSLHRAGAARAIEACRKAGVVLGLGCNKRFWPSMRELRRIVAAGEIGDILHIEGHYSNENSSSKFSSWRESPAEAPGGGMTGCGIHMLDALVSVAGPMRRVTARFASRKPAPDPFDSVLALFEFTSGASGTFSTVRPSPLYWRVHVFGTDGSAEALGESEVVVRRKGGKQTVSRYDPVDTLRAEFDSFADAVGGRSQYPIPTAQMLAVVSAFEAVIKSIDSGNGMPVEQG